MRKEPKGVPLTCLLPFARRKDPWSSEHQGTGKLMGALHRQCAPAKEGTVRKRSTDEHASMVMHFRPFRKRIWSSRVLISVKSWTRKSGNHPNAINSWIHLKIVAYFPGGWVGHLTRKWKYAIHNHIAMWLDLTNNSGRKKPEAKDHTPKCFHRWLSKLHNYAMRVKKDHCWGWQWWEGAKGSGAWGYSFSWLGRLFGKWVQLVKTHRVAKLWYMFFPIGKLCFKKRWQCMKEVTYSTFPGSILPVPSPTHSPSAPLSGGWHLR